GCSTATVTRQVQDLEARLGVRLLVRMTRWVRPTDAGATYHRHCQRILEDLAEADAQASRQALEPCGVLRVSAPLSFGWHRLGAAVERRRPRP
ncbi:LysR family transcriptional regulator, partial [Nitrococcus mobilis]